MHPWIQTVIDICTKNYKGDMKAFDEDPLAKAISLEPHCYGDFSMANVQANEVMEDQSQVEVASSNGLFLGIYDGHGGADASSFIVENLFKNLLRLASENNNTLNEATLRNAVSATEEGFLEYVKTNYAGKPILGKVGSCCLAGVIWEKTLYLANLGDSRAIIVSKNNGQFVLEQLTRDHNCEQRGIREELKSMHLDDPNIVMLKNGIWRVKGIIAVSRTIGDAYLKRPEFTLRDSFPMYEKVPEPFDRPVISADPEMHARALNDNDKFLIFASDGLWELLSNEEVAKIVESSPRKAIAQRILSIALGEAARRRRVLYKDIQNSAPGRIGVTCRRSYHDDISVIVVFLDKPPILKRRVLNLAYRGSTIMSRPSDFAQSGLTSLAVNPRSPRRFRDSFNRRFRSNSDSPRTPRTPLAESSQVEDSPNEPFINPRPPAQSRWESLKKRFLPKRS